MTEVAAKNLASMSDEKLERLYAYLKTLYTVNAIVLTKLGMSRFVSDTYDERMQDAEQIYGANGKSFAQQTADYLKYHFLGGILRNDDSGNRICFSEGYSPKYFDKKHGLRPIISAFSTIWADPLVGIGGVIAHCISKRYDRSAIGQAEERYLNIWKQRIASDNSAKILKLEIDDTGQRMEEMIVIGWEFDENKKFDSQKVTDRIFSYLDGETCLDESNVRKMLVENPILNAIDEKQPSALRVNTPKSAMGMVGS